MASDAELLDHRASDETQAFGVLAERHGAALVRYAFVLVRDADDAQDLAQETLLTAWHKRRQVRTVDGSALPWLLTTCRNHAANHLRKRSRNATIALGDADVTETVPTPLEQVLNQEMVDWISAGVAELSTDMRTVVEACLLDDRSYQEVANDLGLEVAAVSQRVSRARRSLRARRDRKGQGVLA